MLLSGPVEYNITYHFKYIIEINKMDKLNKLDGLGKIDFLLNTDIMLL